MAIINSVSANGTVFHGKADIWFSAHPDDYPLYFESLKNDVFAVYPDAVIHYDEEPMADYDESSLAMRLSEMNLFVMPITENLLSEDNRVISFEFKLAKEKKIPILPIKMTSAIEDSKINEIFHSIHVIKAYGNERERFPGELKEKLYQMLAPFSMIDKIKNEFCAQIFLSYRKLDIESAMNIVKLIRKNSFCRDVAIWYDKYLTVGENFDDEIKKALIESDLFVLCITDKIIDKVEKNGKMVKNYVVDKEFREAWLNDKKILPIKAAQISEKKLGDNFKHIPPSIRSTNEAAISEALRKNLGSKIVKTKKDSAQHEYLIGLAYLHGILVETDRELAIRLIKNAAARNNMEAIEYLITMYRTGLGVDVDYNEAIRLQKKLVDIYEKHVPERKELAFFYLQKVNKLSEYLCEMGRFDEANDENEHAFKNSELLGLDGESYCLAWHYIVRIATDVANYHLERNNIESALKYAKKAEAILEAEMAESDKDTSVSDDGIMLYDVLSRIYNRCNKQQERESYRKKSQALIKISEESCSNDIDLAQFLLATLNERSFCEERDVLTRVIGILDAHCKNDPTIDELKLFAVAHLSMSEHIVSESLRYTLNDDNMPSIIVNNMKEFRERDGFSVYGIYERDKALSDAIEHATIALEIMQRIAKQTGAYIDKTRLSEAAYNLADLIHRSFESYHGDQAKPIYEQVKKYIDLAVETQKEICATSDITSNNTSLAKYLSARSGYVYHYVMVGALDTGAKNLCIKDAESELKIYEKLYERVGSENYKDIIEGLKNHIKNLYDEIK